MLFSVDRFSLVAVLLLCICSCVHSAEVQFNSSIVYNISATFSDIGPCGDFESLARVRFNGDVGDRSCLFWKILKVDIEAETVETLSSGDADSACAICLPCSSFGSPVSYAVVIESTQGTGTGTGNYELSIDDQPVFSANTSDFSYTSVFQFALQCTLAPTTGDFCEPHESVFELVLNADNFPNETIYSIVSLNDGLLASHQEGFRYCLACGGSYLFTAVDIGGDGICCDKGNGQYVALVNGSSVGIAGQFDQTMSHAFETTSCPL